MKKPCNEITMCQEQGCGWRLPGFLPDPREGEEKPDPDLNLKNPDLDLNLEKPDPDPEIMDQYPKQEHIRINSQLSRKVIRSDLNLEKHPDPYSAKDK